jgi:hypothetical protein
VEIVAEVADVEIVRAIQEIAEHPLMVGRVREASCVHSESTSAEPSYSPA